MDYTPAHSKILAFATAWLCLGAAAPPAHAVEASLRFYGHGGSAGENFVFPDRVKIEIEPHSPADIGAGDFTIDFWLRCTAAENTNPALSCGYGIDWVNGNILIDRDRYNQERKWGIALLGGRIAFGVSSDVTAYTLCGTTDVRDDAWHHVAVQRRESDGLLSIYVDGALDADGPATFGPSGDVSYPDGAGAGDYCSPDGGAGGSTCDNSDRFLVFGAEKHGFQGINYSGWLDEVRLSDTLRYDGNFPRPTVPHVPDLFTRALYHFNEGAGIALGDSAGATGGPSDGVIFFGGAGTQGPAWSSETPFALVTAVSSGTDTDTNADRDLALYPPVPSIGRGDAKFRFHVRSESRVSARIFDVRGRLVKSIANAHFRAGNHEIHWDGAAATGRAVAPGIYFIRLETAYGSRTERFVRVR